MIAEKFIDVKNKVTYGSKLVSYINKVSQVAIINQFVRMLNQSVVLIKIIFLTRNSELIFNFTLTAALKFRIFVASKRYTFPLNPVADSILIIVPFNHVFNHLIKIPRIVIIKI